MIPDNSELWVITENAQYRIQRPKPEDKIKLTFWIPDAPIEHFNTTYENLLKMLKSSDKSLYSPIP
jgi:hypothetical protein